MLKKLLFLFLLLFFFGFTGIAGATRICPPSICPPDSDFRIWHAYDHIDKELKSGDSIAYELNITPYFDPIYDYLHSALVGFIIEGAADKNKAFLANWTYNDVGSEWRFGYAPAGGKTLKLDLLLRGDPLDMLNEDGILRGVFSAYYCGTDKLTLKKAFLIAKGCDVDSVPEPATMMLLGLSLVIVAGFGRKKFKNKRKK